MAAIKHLFSERLSDLPARKVGAELDRLTRSGLLSYDAARKEWSLTDEGERALRTNRDWTFEVEDVFELSLGPQPIAVGVIHGDGALYEGDWFLVERTQSLGRILRIELVNARGRNDLVGLGFVEAPA